VVIIPIQTKLILIFIYLSFITTARMIVFTNRGQRLPALGINIIMRVFSNLLSDISSILNKFLKLNGQKRSK